MNFILDPYIFALDKATATQDQLEKFIQNLLDWHRLIELNWGRVFRPTDAFDILLKYELYPYIDTVKELVVKYRIDYIQPEGIDKIINAILQKIPTVEDITEIDDVLFDTNNCTCQGNRNDEFFFVLKRMVVELGIYCVLNGSDFTENVIISKEIGQHTIKFDAVVSIIEPDKGIELPYPIAIEFYNFDNFEMFCTSFDPVKIWLNAKGDYCINMSLNVSLKQEGSEFDYLFTDLKPNFVFQDSFFKSVYNMQFDTNAGKIERLLRAMVEEVLKNNMSGTHALRESKGGSAKQISCDGYKAWRRDIDREYHLHYWKQGGFIVFADVVVHDNFTITPI